ncbi:hypothetical protein HOF65_01190 [bacterium]|jgi:hypothetical protein|nr:hypothetical protein [bacterium]MBT6779228.1 hypothetical protein [bacterium]
MNIIENTGSEKIAENINLFKMELSSFSIFSLSIFRFSFTLNQFDSISLFTSLKLIFFSSYSILASFVARLIAILDTQVRSFNEFSLTITQLAQVIHSIKNFFFILF